jgi:hypothetical protein
MNLSVSSMSDAICVYSSPISLTISFKKSITKFYFFIV